MPRSRFLVSALVVSALVASSCKRAEREQASSSSSGGIDAPGFDKQALLRSFGECALTTFREFQATTPDLRAATERADVEGSAAAREAAREAWRKSMEAWQRAELFAIGPTATAPAVGAGEQRDPIYAWPLVNRCLIEQQILEQTYAKPEFANALATTRGLSAMEYVLFHDGADNACPPSATMNASGSWNALGAAEITKRKNAYARAIAADTAARATQLVDAWDPAKGNFVGELANAPTKTYASQQIAFNAVSNALLYVDDLMANMKVGYPSGLTPGGFCKTPPCLDAVESPWAKRSKEHLRQNLAGFERQIRGCGANAEGLGWEDLLVAVGDQALATKLVDAIAAARRALDALSGASFENDIVDNPNGVRAFYDSLRALVTLLKTELVTVLDLELPKRLEGDND